MAKALMPFKLSEVCSFVPGLGADGRLFLLFIAMKFGQELNIKLPPIFELLGPSFSLDRL